MIGVVVVTHGQLAIELVNAAEMICGDLPQFAAVSIGWHDEMNDAREDINVYGPRMPRDTPYAGVASIFRSALEAGRAPEVFEDGRQLRDFVHVRDVARANVMALTGDVPVPGPLNIGTGQPRSVGDMAEALCEAFGPAAPRARASGRFRLGDVRHVFAATNRAARELGFHASVPFDRGMGEFGQAQLRPPSLKARP